MLRHAHFYMKGGKRKFAALAKSNTQLDGSRHSQPDTRDRASSACWSNGIVPIFAKSGSSDLARRRDLPQSTSHSIQLVGQKVGRGRLISRTKGGMNTKLHAVTDTIGRPIRLFMTAGQVSDYTGARALVSSLPAADWLLGDRGHDADWFREDLVNMGITPCIPGRKSREKPVKYDKRQYKRRNRIDIMFGRLKDWRRVATRYDRCPKVFLSAIALAATVLFWL
jgi:transposase